MHFYKDLKCWESADNVFCFLQDLLKYTPKDHVDRRALQLAVTVLENLAHKLNEHKRENEQKFAVKQILTKIREGLTKHHLTTHDKYLIRQDDMLHIVSGTINCFYSYHFIKYYVNVF